MAETLFRLPRVGVSIGVTLNIGNYESIRADARFDVDVENERRTGQPDFQGAYGVCFREAQMGLESALDGMNKMIEKRDANVTLKTRRR
jgi:hypothetical protein